jgi:protein-disulfide isomerase
MKREYVVPAAIIFAGIIISFAIYAVRHHTADLSNGNPEAVRAVSSNDHVLGNPSAPVVFIEYADIDSEYSKTFQPVMDQLLQTYGATGNVAWVYRHFPLDPTSDSESDAEAAECVASLGGTHDFFAFVDAVETAAPGDAQFSPADYDQVVTSLGLASGSFDGCMTAHTYQKKVLADAQNAALIGATGSPYTILLIKGLKPEVISGAVPYETAKQIVDTAIKAQLGQ